MGCHSLKTRVLAKIVKNLAMSPAKEEQLLLSGYYSEQLDVTSLPSATQ